ncbi:MAG: glycosyltransferase family 2 protein [Lachnospira sp.]|nr:glycosyltransferase family 2 protein [Lachnospira sp.]
MEETLIIVPAYNVSNQIKSVLFRMKKYKRNCLLINDGSSDNTLEIIKQENFRVINMPYNCGVSQAILEGLKYALENDYKYVLLMDADGQHNPDDIDKFLNALKDYDIVFGNRFDSTISIPTCKTIANAFASAVYKQVSSRFLPDVACGYKAFKVSKDLIDYLLMSKGYSIVYRLVNYSILMDIPIFNISTNAIYYYNSFLGTRTNEVNALLTSAIELNNIYFKLNDLHEKLNTLLEKILTNQDIDIILSDIHFYAFYINAYNSYIFQASIDEVNNYYLCNYKTLN